MLGENDIVVEGDESLFGRRKYNHKRQRNQTRIIGFVKNLSHEKYFSAQLKKEMKNQFLKLLIKKFTIN